MIIRKTDSSGAAFSSGDSLTHRVEQLSDHSTTIRAIGAGFAARGRPRLSSRERNWSRQCHSLQCSPVHGFGRLRNYPHKQGEGQAAAIESARTQTRQNKTNSKRPTDQKWCGRGGQRSLYLSAETVARCESEALNDLSRLSSVSIAKSEQKQKTKQQNNTNNKRRPIGVQQGTPTHPVCGHEGAS